MRSNSGLGDDPVKFTQPGNPADMMYEQQMAHMAAIVASSDDAIISKTLDGIVTSWNSAAERIFGYTAAEMIGQPILKVIPADRAQEEPRILEQLKNGRRVDHFETKRVTKDGSIIDISLTISPIKDHNGIITGASKIARDITLQKQAEETARNTEDRFKLAVAATQLGFWEQDLASGDFAWSAECEQILGFDDDGDTNFTYSSFIYPADREMVQEKLEAVISRAHTGDYMMQHRIVRYNDNEVKWVRVRGKVYFNLEGSAERFTGTMLDVTEEVESKLMLENTVHERTQELVHINERLEKSNHDLEQFAYIASHDLQEPLRKIQTFIDIIHDDKMGPEVNQGYFGKIAESARRMSMLIRDVLDYSRLSRGEQQALSVDLNAVLDDIRSDFEITIQEKGAVITNNTLPVLKGSASQLRQLFANLISNSLKFCPNAPRIEITARLLPAAEKALHNRLLKDRDYVEIQLSDNGIGFDPQYAEKIFIIFQRLHTRKQYSGTGIGLALCRKIVENHNGVIYARAGEKQGATFTVLLPVK